MQYLAPQRFIEARFPREQLVSAGPGRRLAGYLLESILGVITLGVGYLVWFVIVAKRGQTPGKQLLRMYVIKEDGTRAGGWYTVLRELVIKPAFVLISIVTLGLLSLVGGAWCLWDRDNQCLWDKLGSTYVAWSPNGYRPLTAREMREQTSAERPSPPPQKLAV